MTKLKIKKISAVDQVSEYLKSNILSGKWAIGEKLPSETELANDFAVNRLTVRMALQGLNTLGVIETKAGDGTYVKKFSINNILTEISGFYLEEREYEDIYALRRLIEIECCRLAILMATDKDFVELEKSLNIYLESNEIFKSNRTEENLDLIVESDLAFHHQIYIMSKNKVYSDIFNIFKDFIKAFLKEIVSKRVAADNSKGNYGVDSHILIFTALKERDFEKCKEIYIETLTYEKPKL